jgi:hypothetical protein
MIIDKARSIDDIHSGDGWDNSELELACAGSQAATTVFKLATVRLKLDLSRLRDWNQIVALTFAKRGGVVHDPSQNIALLLWQLSRFCRPRFERMAVPSGHEGCETEKKSLVARGFTTVRWKTLDILQKWRLRNFAKAAIVINMLVMA